MRRQNSLRPLPPMRPSLDARSLAPAARAKQQSRELLSSAPPNANATLLIAGRAVARAAVGQARGGLFVTSSYPVQEGQFIRIEMDGLLLDAKVVFTSMSGFAVEVLRHVSWLPGRIPGFA